MPNVDYLLPASPLIQGLCVPLVTALDAKGQLDAVSQEKLLAFVSRGEAGAGAQAVFSNGTTGEWRRLPLALRLKSTEAVHYALSGGRGPKLWAGVNDAAAGGLLQGLEHALKLGAAAAVVAPLAVEDVKDPLTLFHRHITPLYQRLGKGLPVFLYDNPEEFRHGRQDRLRTSQVKQLARLDYVAGVKVTADAKTAGNYLRAARHSKARHEFGVYLGRASQAFGLFAPAAGWWGNLNERWRHFWVASEPPQGIVPGSANLFPSAWRAAWTACVAGDTERMRQFQAAFGRLHQGFRFGGVHKGVACLKAALAEEGVLASPTLAAGTPSLSAEEHSRWMLAYRNAKQELGVLTGAAAAAVPLPKPGPTVLAAERPQLLGFGAAVVDGITPVPGFLAADAKQRTHGPASRHAGGVIFNQLAWAHALGLRSGLVGGSGSGEGAAFLRAEAQRLGVDTEGWKPMAGVDADVARIFASPKGERAIYLEGGASGAQTVEHAGLLKPRLADARFLVTEVSLVPLASVLAALKAATEAGREGFLDLDVPPKLATGAQGLGSPAQLAACLAQATHVKASVEGALQLCPGVATAGLAKALHKKLKMAPDHWVTVTGGARGAWAYDGKKAWRQPAFKVPTVDSTGCGDAFHAGLIVGRSAGWGLGRALALACAAGAVAATAPGAVPPAGAREAVQALLKAELPLPALPLLRQAPDDAAEHLRVALAELEALAAAYPLDSLQAAQALISAAEGTGHRLHVTGVGKCEYVAGFVASSYSSTGTPSFFLHATEAAHGASGQVRAGDVVIAISNSGETDELKAAVLTLKKNGAVILGVSGKPASWLARHSDAFLWAGVRREGDELGLAPRASVLAEILVLNALGVALQHRKAFTAEQFKAFHPGGSLGKTEEG
jgi:arabinose-5-phosphate isomerase